MKINENIRNEFSHHTSNKENVSFLSNKITITKSLFPNNTPQKFTEKGNSNFNTKKEMEKKSNIGNIVRPNICILSRYNNI